MEKTFCFSFLLFFCCSLLQEGESACNRQYSPPPADCSTRDGDPCLIYSEEEGSGGLPIAPMGLAFPSANSRTCYRTCHDEDDVCHASLVPTVNNSAITKVITYTNETSGILLYSLQEIHSPNYNKGKNYRKSTICRYDVECPGDQLLSYGFVSHSLESRANCSTENNTCVDYVKLTFPSLGPGETVTCGEEADQTVVHMDGTQVINVEFFANRDVQESGFMIFVWCSNPALDINYSLEGEEEEEEERKRSVGEEIDCATVSDSVRVIEDPMDTLKQNVEEASTLTKSDSFRITMNELDTLTYINSVIRIIPGRFSTNKANSTFENIQVLHVSNRLQRDQQFFSKAAGFFQGYAEVWISEGRCFVLQLGVNPILRPTEGELELILKFQQQLKLSLKNSDYFDVLDSLDIEENGGHIPDSSSTSIDSDFQPNREISELAVVYGNACNGLLRTVSCAYQQLILQRDCMTGERIVESTRPTATPTFTESHHRTTPSGRPASDPTRRPRYSKSQKQDKTNLFHILKKKLWG